MIPNNLTDTAATKALVATMFIGQISGYAQEAMRIKPVVKTLMGENFREVDLGMALAAITSGDTSFARDLILKGMDDLPNKDRMQLIFATAFIAQGDPLGVSVLNGILRDSEDPETRTIAQELMRLNSENSPIGTTDRS